MRPRRVGLDPQRRGRRALGPEARLRLLQSGGDFMGVEEILDLTKRVPPRATDRVPNRDADRERYQFLPPLRYHDPMVPQADHQPAQDLELKRSTAAEQLLRRLVPHMRFASLTGTGIRLS